MTKIRLLPFIMIVAVCAFGIRLNSVWSGFQDVIPTAQAQEADESLDAVDTDAEADAVTEDPSELDEDVFAAIDPAMMSRSEIDLLQDLSARREALDTREGDIAMREGLLAATEKRIDEKIATLQGLETRIDGLLKIHQQRENEELDSIVKVYSSMKAKAAAGIFQSLEMPTQIDLAVRMKEAKMAPILAAMSPEAARQLTMELANRSKLDVDVN